MLVLLSTAGKSASEISRYKAMHDSWVSKYIDGGGVPTHHMNQPFGSEKYILINKILQTGETIVMPIHDEDINMVTEDEDYISASNGDFMEARETPAYIPIYNDFTYCGKQSGCTVSISQ